MREQELSTTFGPLARRPCYSVRLTLAAWLFAGLVLAEETPGRGKPWPRHVIDDSSRGADGVRLADVNGDKLLDVVTGWEQGGLSRVYLHPGHSKVRSRWPAVTVGSSPNVEDAVFVDLDNDAAVDVVSCCEGGTQTVFVHWAPRGDPRRYLDPSAWKTEPIPASQGRMRWMFAVPLQIDGTGGVDLVAAGKGDSAQIGWFQSPGDPRRLDQWQWHPISPAGWIMSLRPLDIDGDADLDILTTDRKGAHRGCRWLQNPGPAAAQELPEGWNNHTIGAEDHEVMFLAVADLDADGRDELLMASKDNGLIWFRRRAAQGDWQSFSIRMPENVGSGKGCAVGDINGDGTADVVVSCEHARDGRSGVVWLSYRNDPREQVWTAHEISGPEGIKFDRLELLDLDGDLDLDVLACEESEPVGHGRQGLGVFWYANPLVTILGSGAGE